MIKQFALIAASILVHGAFALPVRPDFEYRSLNLDPKVDNGNLQPHQIVNRLNTGFKLEEEGEAIDNIDSSLEEDSYQIDLDNPDDNKWDHYFEHNRPIILPM